MLWRKSTLYPDVINETVAERKNFKLLFSAGITLAVKVSILYFRPMGMI